jgi:ankyrin repeat protein
MAADSSVASLPPEAIALAGRLYDAARAGDKAIFQQALPAGLPANMTNDKGDSLIMLAAYYGHAELVQLLLQHGADPNRLNDKGQSPLAGAVFKMHHAVIDVRGSLSGITGETLADKTQALLSGGADPEFGNPNALQCIAMFKQEENWQARFQSAPGRGKASENKL